MIERCSRCNRRLTGFVSTQLGIGPVCIAKSQRQKAEEANRAQADLFEGELATATLSSRVRSLLARLNALDERAQKLNDAEALSEHPTSDDLQS